MQKQSRRTNLPHRKIFNRLLSLLFYFPVLWLQILSNLDYLLFINTSCDFATANKTEFGKRLFHEKKKKSKQQNKEGKRKRYVWECKERPYLRKPHNTKQKLLRKWTYLCLVYLSTKDPISRLRNFVYSTQELYQMQTQTNRSRNRLPAEFNVASF